MKIMINTNKIRELEFWSDELKTKLDAALEENIIIHNENTHLKTTQKKQSKDYRKN